MAWWDNDGGQDAGQSEEAQVPNVTLTDDETGETVNMNGGADVDEEMETVAEDSPADERHEEPTAAAEGKRRGEGRRARGGREKAKNAKKPMTSEMVGYVRRVSEAIEYKDMLPAVKALLDTSSNDVNNLIAMLTEPKNRDRVNAVIKKIEDIASAGERERMMIVALGIQADPSEAKTLFSVLSALAPDRGFGRASGDAQKDARTIDDKWGDGVDASALKSFLY